MGAEASSRPKNVKNTEGSREIGPPLKPLGTCHPYNKSECRREKCNFLHLCHKYVKGSCNLGKDCPKSHNVHEDNVKAILEKHGINTNAKPEEIENALRTRIGPLPKILATCTLHNESECKNEKCNLLHLCEDFVYGHCRQGQDCPKSHDVLDRNVKAILEKHGINTNAKPKVIRDALRNMAREAKQRGQSESLESPINHPQRHPKNAIAGVSHPHTDKRVNADKTRATEQSSKTTEQKPGEAEDVRICYRHLRGKCWSKKKCIHFHAELPYQWRYRLTSQKEWKPLSLDSNLTVEEKFSDPQNQSGDINLSGGKRMKILFEVMRGSDGQNNQYDIQRLSTSSSVKYPNHPLATEWQWYWKSDEGTWNKYESSDSSSTIQDIEQDYQTNPVGQTVFKSSNHEYVLDFQKMVQCNLKLGTKRDMTRRPVFVSKDDVEKKKELLRGGPKKQAEPDIKIPSCWKVESDVDFSDHYALVKVANDQEECKKIEKYFLDTFQKNVSIKTIERIENGELWESYINKRDKMSKKRANKDVQERQLFHGTASDCIEVICRQGFDFRLSGQRVGAKYGKGSYFATTSKYSDSYADLVGSEKRMFVVKALVGDYTQGEASFVRPPLKDPDNLCSPLYDSCVNNPNDPTIFVIFDICQVYPEYLITYNPGTN